MLLTYSVSWEYDSYYCDGCYGCDTGNDYCRGSRYEGLRIERIYWDSVASDIISYLGYMPNHEHIKDVVEILQASDLESNLEIDSVAGYYGDEAEVVLYNDHLYLGPVRWYLEARPDAVDNQGILEFVRAVGYSTVGMAPIDALKAYIEKSNFGARVKSVDEAKIVSLEKLDLDKVIIKNEAHFDKIQARTDIDPPRSIVGVVVKGGGRFELVDGYHRLKAALKKKQKTGYFYVLHQE